MEPDRYWRDDSHFLVAKKGAYVKAYPVRDLTRHEVVNDVLDGEPIFAAYCILADFGAIYKRTYGDNTFTFAVSGYTYYDPDVWNGLDGFILWDRETESLWWPLIDKAVSGPLKGARLQKIEAIHWEDVTWRNIKQNYPDAQIMEKIQRCFRYRENLLEPIKPSNCPYHCRKPINPSYSCSE